MQPMFHYSANPPSDEWPIIVADDDCEVPDHLDDVELDAEDIEAEEEFYKRDDDDRYVDAYDSQSSGSLPW
jgi:hypothetical protein